MRSFWRLLMGALFLAFMQPCSGQGVFVPSQIRDFKWLPWHLRVFASYGQGRAVSNRAHVPNNGTTDPNATYSGALNVTYRVRHTFPKACYDLRLVYPNFWMDGATTGEQATGNAITVEAGVEYGGVTYRVTFGGANQISIPDQGMVVSDPIGVDITAGSAAHIRTWVSVASAGQKWPAMQVVVSGAGDGYTASSNLSQSTGALANSSGFLYCPIAVLGSTDPYSVASMAGFGDSLMKGNGDDLASNNGSFFIDAMDTAALPFINLATNGMRAAETAIFSNIRNRVKLLSSASHVVIMLGTNDQTTRTSAQVTADLLSIGTYCARRGCYVYLCTLPPYVSSSNAFVDYAGQTKTGGGTPADSTRVAVNAWIRTAPATYPTIFRGFFETANKVETNSSGTLTQDGGYWFVGTTQDSGTATAGSSSTLTDSGKAWTTNQYAKYTLHLTGGAGSGQVRTIQSNTGTSLTLASSFSPAPDGTTTYQIRNAYTVDGVHLSGLGHDQAGTAITTATFRMAAVPAPGWPVLRLVASTLPSRGLFQDDWEVWGVSWRLPDGKREVVGWLSSGL